MNEQKIREMLAQFKQGELPADAVVNRLKALPFEELPFASIDHHRALRTGIPEVIFCEGKSNEQIRTIFNALKAAGGPVLLTRLAPEVAQSVFPNEPDFIYDELGRVAVFAEAPIPQAGNLLILCAGTADTPVAEEAAITAETCGAKVTRIYDVGVAGLHRLLAHIETIQQADVIICLAGMEGALVSVVGGLCGCPVIAVPTSVGYGTHLNGIVPLLGMLNSCASNVSVVNIDNGFSAGYIAAMIAKKGNA